MKRVLLFTLLLSTIGFSSKAQQPDSVYTVGRIMSLIRENIKPGWTDTRTDTIVIGHAEDTVTGIATCMFVDMNILQRAVAANCNLIVTHEPVFYTATDQVPEFMKEDRVLMEKVNFIREHHLTIYRLHDNAHRNNPDMIMQGLVDDLGWKLVVKRPWIAEVKKQSLSALAKSLKKHFGLSGIRVIGNPDLSVTHVAFVPGMAPTPQMHIGPLQRDDVDVILVGEAREWEDYVYVRDAVLQDKKKAAIFIGHLKSEEPGMKYAAEWLKTFLKETPVRFLKAENYWWTPK